MAGRQDPEPRRVVAWGRSVLVSALFAGLAHRPGLEVAQVEATLPAALDALQRRRAHAVVCDLATVPAACVLALLAAQAHLAVVIVDSDADLGMVLSCRQTPMQTMDDLVAALLEGADGGEDVAPSPIASPRGRLALDCPPPVPHLPTTSPETSAPEVGCVEDSG